MRRGHPVREKSCVTVCTCFRKDNDVNRRLAMISIDNAVELMIKTYLGLPKRITGLGISRKDFQDISESSPGNA